MDSLRSEFNVRAIVSSRICIVRTSLNAMRDGISRESLSEATTRGVLGMLSHWVRYMRH